MIACGKLLSVNLLNPERAVNKIAGSLLAGPHLIDEIVELRVNRETLLKSACLLSVFNALGHRLRDYSHQSNISTTLKHLLSGLGENPIHEMQGHHGLGETAQKSLVEGLVIWEIQHNSLATVNQTLDLIHFLIGDPRIYPTRWKSITPDVRQRVEWWLTERTLGAFFQVFRMQNAVKPKMVADRENFWRGYMKMEKISRAWLITGANGIEISRQLLGKSFGQFFDGAGPDHIGLMLQIGNYVILEMNQTGSTLLWQAADTEMPSFFQPAYHRKTLIDICNKNGGGRFRMTHQPPDGWQKKYEYEIFTRTNISRN